MANYLVIGGSSGIGESLTKLLDDQGHRVYATYNQHPVQDHSNTTFHQLDVTSEELDLSFIPDVLDGLVYCPGSIDLKPFKRIKYNELISDFNLQVGGAVKVLQQTEKNLRASNLASVIFISTVAVQTGFNFHAQVAASKGALEGLTRALAAEFAPKVRVNAVAPSLTDTPLASGLLSNDDKKKANAERHPLKRIGQSTDIANAIAFLLSEHSSWITGQIIPVDGGISTLK